MNIRNSLALAVICAALLAGCGMSLAQPTAPPVLSGDAGIGLGGQSLPSSWTPDPTFIPLDTSTPVVGITPTITRTPFAPPTPASAWREYTVPQDSYTLRLPPTWLSLPLENQDAYAVVAQIGQDNPALAASLHHGVPVEMLNAASFIAFDSAGTVSDATFVSTLRVSRAATGDYRQEATQRTDVLEADPAFGLEAGWPVSVGFEARRGWLVRYSSAYPPDAPTVITFHTQIYVENGQGQVVVFTFSTEAALRDGYELLFDLVMDGVHFTL
jgi:hypothetical protein